MKYIIPILFLLIKVTIAQIDSSASFELIGNLQYNFTNNYHPYGSYATFYSKSHIMIIQPELGYYLIDNLEIVADIDYSISTSLWNTLGPIDSISGRPETQIDNDYITHRLGFYLGAGYNFPLGVMTDLFFGTRIGVSSSRINLSSEGFQTIHSRETKRIETVNSSYDSGWRDMEVSFPSFLLALKLFPNPYLIVILKIQYTKTNSYNGSPNGKMEQLTFGIGLGTSFK